MGDASISYLAALTGVKPELHEVAMVEGASKIRRIWHIDLPCILPTIVTLLIMQCGRLMSVGFDKAYLMQNALNLSASEVLSTYVYKIGMLNSQFSFCLLYTSRMWRWCQSAVVTKSMRRLRA